MKADFTRETFDPTAQRRTVRFQQGRPPIDAEINESQDILANRIEIEAADIIGPAGGPVGNAGFGLSLTPDGNLEVSAGRYYVDGILCELAEAIELPADEILMPEPLPGEDGIYLVYLGVWIDHLTALEDPSMQEVALHGAETTTREVVRAQIRFAKNAIEVGPEEVDCMEDIYNYDALSSPPTGTLAARAEPESIPPNDCSMTPGAGYRRLENQLYRVEIHTAGDHNSATYKWSRENGSILAPWLGIDGNEITVGEQGRDPNRAFRPGNWVELIDRERELRGKPGTLVQLVNVNENTLTIDPATATDTIIFGDFATTPRVRRWESAGALPINNDPDADGYSNIEYGVQIQFSVGTYHSADYWLIPARTTTGDVEWPRDAISDEPKYELRKGIWHHYAKLAIVELSGETWSILKDCRNKFPPLGRYRSCCQLFVGDGKTSHGDFDSFDEALKNLPVAGGSICFLPGLHHVDGIILNRTNLKISGCGEASRIAPKDEAISPAVFTVLNRSSVHFEKLGIENVSGIGIYFGPVDKNGPRECGVSNCSFKTRSSAIVAERCKNLTICNNSIVQPHAQFGGPALIIMAAFAVIEKNTIRHVPGASEDPEAIAWGGIQILGGSAECSIESNIIYGAGGNGITLGGSLQDYDAVINKVSEQRMTFVELLQQRSQQKGNKSVAPELLRDLTNPKRSRNLPISRIRIRKNNILRCGLSAIGIIPPTSLDQENVDGLSQEFSLDTFGGGIFAMIFDALFPTEPEFYRERVIESLIEDNTIERVFLLDAPELAGTQVYGFGGITLGATRFVTIRHNEIRDFGDPTEKAATGIFVLAAEGLNIEGNTICSLPAGDPTNKLPQGFRGGIIVRLAMKDPSQQLSSAGESITHTPHSLEVVNNSVESQRGRALTLLGFGDMRVEDNRLQSGAPGPSIMDRIIGNALILNLGGLLETLRLFYMGKKDAEGQANEHIGDAQMTMGSYFYTTTYNTGEAAADEASASLKMEEYDPKRKSTGEAYALFGARTSISRNRFILTEQNIAPLGQLFAGLGDTSFIENQSTSFQLHTLPLHSVIISAQLRAAHNRLSEVHPGISGSLVTLAFGHNSTVDNQTDHCIYARSAGLGGGTLSNHHNQILYATQCARLGAKGGQTYMTMMAYSIIAANAGEDVSESAKKDLTEKAEPAVSELFDTNNRALVENTSKSLEESLVAIELADNQAVESMTEALDGELLKAHPRIELSDTYSKRAHIIRNYIDTADASPSKATAPAKGHARVEGKLSVKDRQIIQNAKVELVSGQSGKLLAESAISEDGGFNIDLNAGTVKDIEKRKASELRMVIRAKDGTILKELDAPFTTLAPNTVARGTINLNPLTKFDIKKSAGDVVTKRTNTEDTLKKTVKPAPAKKVVVVTAKKKTVQPEATKKKIVKTPTKKVSVATPTKKVVKKTPVTKKATVTPVKKSVQVKPPSLKVLSDLNPGRIRILERQGIRSIEDVAKVDPRKLSEIVGEERAKKLITEARRVMKKQNT